MAIISSKFKRLIDTNRFALYTVFAVLTGVFFAQIIKGYLHTGPNGKIDHQLLRYLSLPGVIYMRAFILIIAPLLVTSLSLSFLPIKSENPFDKLRRFNDQKQKQQQRPKKKMEKFDAHKLIVVTFIVFGAFSLLASIFGACLMLTFGSFASPYSTDNDDDTDSDEFISSNNQTIPNDLDENIRNQKHYIIHKYYQHDTVYNSFLNIFPDNMITPFFMSSYSKTKILWPANLSILLDPNYHIETQNEKLINYKANMLSLCIISLCLGVILQKLGPDRTKRIRSLLYEADTIIHYVMQFLMKLLPIGMFCWMFAESLKMASLSDMAVKLAYFYLIVVGAFMFWLFVFYPVVYIIFTRENPFKLYKNILSAIVIAFGSCSSAITLPETMRCMRKNCQLSNRICQTVLPLGMTLHMNGPAMYFPMTAIFVAYINQTPVGFYSVIVLCLFAVIMSMGVPPVIGTGTTMLNHMAVASVLGVDNPQDILAYVLAFEWMMERIRTSTNIIGDCFAAKCIERILNIQDDEMDDENYLEVESEEKL
ncbi:excitatory amino acid transporter-like [Dermatophagoides pteronyssinus]|uniref:Amino acid transporter n=1 Tax=Dermatophagoides pteronyssinus TaxID=6956 RepID=A0ABQ8JC58_DERPT|nr:Excitatory amino acid transporter 2 [Dermatophagoides pteronyssinus]